MRSRWSGESLHAVVDLTLAAIRWPTCALGQVTPYTSETCRASSHWAAAVIERCSPKVFARFVVPLAVTLSALESR